MSHPLRILLLDDVPIIQTTVRILLGTSPDFDLVGATANIAELPALCRQNQPHIVLLGSNKPALTSEIIFIVEQVCPQTRIILLLNAADPLPVPDIRVAGCCFKEEINEGLLHLLRAIRDGMTWVSGGVATRLRTQAVAPGSMGLHPDLTPAEQQHYVLLGHGWSNKQIAVHLQCTPQTVCNYNSRIYKKLGINRLALIAEFQNSLKQS